MNDTARIFLAVDARMLAAADKAIRPADIASLPIDVQMAVYRIKAAAEIASRDIESAIGGTSE